MVDIKITVFLEPSKEGGLIAKCLELPVATQGETKEEALSSIKEAIEGYLEVKAKLLGSKTNGEKTEITVEVVDSIEEVVMKELPEVAVSNEGKKEINRSIKEMKKGNFLSLDEVRDA